MSRLATPVLLLALPLAFFLALFHPATLDIGNPGWLIRGTDNGENALGAHAYWHDADAGASLRVTLLNAPAGVPVLYTDSNPLVTLAAKPFVRLLPVDAQLVGPFVLASLILQAFFAWMLLRRHAPGAAALWIGVALLAFPPTLANRFVHLNLMAHWTILAALWLFLHPRREVDVRWWTPLITVTALIHAYLLVMVGAIWASAMLAELREGDRARRIAAVGQGGVVVAMVMLLAWWLGVGDQSAAGNFGRFSMPLDALWNPQVANFTRLLPGWEASAGRGFEGFQYMGAGGLLLVLAAIAMAWCRPVRPRERRVLQRLRALTPALAVLTMLALARLPLPAGVLALLDPIRASGRLFWPVGYVLVLAALLATYRLRAGRAGALLATLLAIQVIDLAPMRAYIHAQNADAGAHRLYVRTVDPRWDAVIARASSVAFLPGDDVTRDLALFQEVAWRAVNHDVPVRNVYAARTSTADRRRTAAERDAFARGELSPERLYVLQATVTLPPQARSRRLVLDGVTIVAPR